jgi:MerR family transcriptional regulator, light-induced transcriptional regulator
MKNKIPDAPGPGLPIAAVERETGLPKDTLRVWERRYGFPQPLREPAGDRLYPLDQVERLKLIRRLLGAGRRPSKVVGLGSEDLLAEVGRLAPPAAVAGASEHEAPDLDARLEELLVTIAEHDPQALRHALTHAQMRLGLASFVTDLVAPLTAAVGHAWAQGRFEIYEEHLFTEVLTGVLRHSIGTLAPLARPGGPAVLLTTLPQEPHGLGLLMVEALLTLEGCSCVSLGVQTPIGDVAQAAQSHRADVVALSFSNVQPGAAVLASLRELRAQLPGPVALWVGGSCGALYQKRLDGVTAVRELAGLKALVAQLRDER